VASAVLATPGKTEEATQKVGAGDTVGSAGIA